MEVGMASFRSHKKGALIAIVLVFILVLLGWWAGSWHNSMVGASQAGATSVTAAAPRVVTWVVSTSTAADIAQVTGTVIAGQRAELSPKIMGRVATVYVHEGQRVSKGQVLVQLEADDLAASAAQASANTGAASASLAQAQTAAALQREQSRSRVEQAAAAFKQAQARLSQVQEGSRTQERAVATQGIVLAEAEARNAQADYQRYNKLFQDGAISAMEADRYRTAAETAIARLEMAKQQASLAYEGSRRQEIDAAKSQVLQAQDTLRLARASAAENRMKEDQVRMARAQLNQSAAARTGANIQYAYSRIVAPFSGVVTARMVDPGDLASPGHPLMVVEDDSQYRLEASVPEEALRHLQLGQKVQVVLDVLNHPLIGRISRIVPSADPSSRTFMVKVDLTSTPGISSGLFGRLQLQQGSRSAIEVPASAVVQRGQLSQIYVVEGGMARLRVVTVGETNNGRTEILSGVQPGEHLVTVPADSLQDGQTVQAISASIGKVIR
jgi:RND family efflux transporter MFP subunit